MKLLHLQHVEDLIFDGQFFQAQDTLAELIETLGTAKTSNHLSVSTKYDGAPAIVFGYHDEFKEFVIGTKSVFNKKIPKIAKSASEIDEFYGDKPELAQKLKVAYTSLFDMWTHGLIPDGVFQGDLMWTSDSIEQDERITRFCENTITYCLNNKHPAVDHMMKANCGMVVHTVYHGDVFAEMVASPVVHHDLFTSDSVYFIDPRVDLQNYILTENQYEIVVNALVYCEQSYKLITDKTIFTRHGDMLRMFINHCVRMGEKAASIGMYRTFLDNRKQHDLSEEVKEKLIPFNTIFAIHRHLDFVKRLLISTLESSSFFFHMVDDVLCNGEGFVVTYHGVQVKLVDRLEFSRNNFLNKKFAKVKANG